VCYTEADCCGDSYLKMGLEYKSLFDRFVCYSEADRCGESYLKMDSAIFLDEELKVHPSFVTSMAANRDRHIHVAKELF
jgi:hypothetical protein